MTHPKIHVLVVDDSTVIRQTLSSILESDVRFSVDVAADPFIAAQKIASRVPDVITLDVEMPRMDGITFLRKIMSQHPIPVVIISSLTERSTETAILAMECGAVDVVKKPGLGVSIETLEQHVVSVVFAASRAMVRRRQQSLSVPATKPLRAHSMLRTTERVVAVGASTGGTEALSKFLQALPADCYGIVIVQHMPEVFTKSFAERLNGLCRITVREASDGQTILRGQALIAPGNKHMEVKRSGARYFVSVSDGEPVNRHRPSVDVLFNSTARYVGRNAIGIIMTGMGADGARGLLNMKHAGAHTIAQDEESCVVFGMPKEAIRLNAADKIMSLDQIAPYLITQ